ncbi:MAG: hypothetical protein LBP65_02255 [Puniceicoccales bacterium]|nr:hypothetical protein [Puniceicoccales bacterium]
MRPENGATALDISTTTQAKIGLITWRITDSPRSGQSTSLFRMADAAKNCL